MLHVQFIISFENNFGASLRPLPYIDISNTKSVFLIFTIAISSRYYWKLFFFLFIF